MSAFSIKSSTLFARDRFEFLLGAGLVGLLIIVFLAFRVVSSSANLSVERTLTSLLRHESRSANFYAVGKTIADFEKLGLLSCSELSATESGRKLYSSTQRSWCGIDGRWSPLVNLVNFKLRALNGAEFNLRAQIPTRWKDLMLEVCLNIMIIAAGVLFIRHRRRLELMRKLEYARLEAEKIEIMDVQRQIRHDVASPLSAMKLALSASRSMEAKNRQVLERALIRTESLVDRLRANGTEKSVLKGFDPLQAVEQIILEKRMEWGPSVSFDVVSSHDSITCLGQGEEFKCILSNLLNNSWEAKRSNQDLKISIATTVRDDRLILEILDNGVGMDPEVLARVGTPGFSHGKENHPQAGQGIGVSSAIEKLRAWSGQLQLHSTPGGGTTVTLALEIAGKS